MELSNKINDLLNSSISDNENENVTKKALPGKGRGKNMKIVTGKQTTEAAQIGKSKAGATGKTKGRGKTGPEPSFISGKNLRKKR